METIVNGGAKTDEKLFVPDIKYITPEKSGNNYLDELIRIPDYLTGVVSSIDFNNISPIIEKYNSMMFECLYRSRNISIIQIFEENNGMGLCTRRIKFQ